MNQRKEANLKILTRLSQIIDQYPQLRFQQILIDYGIVENGKDKFYEESLITLKRLEDKMSKTSDTDPSTDGGVLRGCYNIDLWGCYWEHFN